MFAFENLLILQPTNQFKPPPPLKKKKKKKKKNASSLFLPFRHRGTSHALPSLLCWPSSCHATSNGTTKHFVFGAKQPKWALPHFSAHSEHDEQSTPFQSTAAVRAVIEANKRRSKEKKTVGVTLKHNEEERNARDQALTEQVGNRGRGNKTTMKHSESEASHACTTVCMGVCVCACVSNV